MHEAIEFFRSLFSRRSSEERAALAAHIGVPVTVLALGVLGGGPQGFVFDFLGPITIAELRTEVRSDGTIAPRSGVAVILEPSDGEVSLPITGGGPGLWTSLDRQMLEINRNRVSVQGGALSARTPLLGVAGPVTIVVDGEASNILNVPGGTESRQSRDLVSRSAVSILTAVLLAAVFALGIALSASVPHVIPD